MAHLLHIDSSITGEASVSRRLSARAAAAWRAAHPDGTVTYRDLGENPVPHIDAAGGTAGRVPPEHHTPAQAAAWALTREIVGERALVRSHHHQGIGRAGDGLVVSAHAHDGTIEGLEVAGSRFGIGVLWHPEADVPGSGQALFDGLVSSCK